MALQNINSNGAYGADVDDVRALADQVNAGQPGTAWTLTAYTAHASGAVAVTSNAATDLDTTAAALDTLQAEVAALKVVLIAAGIVV